MFQLDESFPEQSASKSRYRPLGEWLLHLGLLTKRQLDAALADQTHDPNAKVGEILARKGYITPQELSDTLAVQAVLNGEIPLSEFPISSKILSLVPENFCIESHVLPVAQIAMRLLVATTDARNFAALDKITVQTGLVVVTIEVGEDELLSAQEQVFKRPIRHAAPLSVTAARQVPPPPPKPNPLLASKALDPASEAAVSELVRSIFEEALGLQARSVLFAPRETGLEVRARVDGIMRKLLEVPPRLAPAVNRHLASLATGGPGALQVEGEKLGFSVSTSPTLYGEATKVELLHLNADTRRLDALGLSPDDLFAYKQLLRGAGGLLLIAGPRHAGRTRTLLSTLGYLDKLSNHVVVIEEASRAPLAGVTQLPLTARPGLTVEAAITLALSQDPDVLIVHRLQTRREVELALDAAERGVKVISTVNASDATSAIAHWVDAGVSPLALTMQLRAVMAVRQVRRNCPHCASLYPATPSERAFLGVSETEELTLARGTGCDYCHQTGYLGQVGLFELMTVTPALRMLLTEQPLPLPALEAHGRRLQATLLDDAMRKVAEGVTTVAEVIRVLGDPGANAF